MLLGLHGTNFTTVPVTSIASFAANTKTEIAYKQFCKDLYQIGVTEDIIQQKKGQILKILKSQGMVTSSPIDNIGDEDQVLEILETAYKELCESLCHTRVTEDMLLPKDKIIEILRSRGVVANSQTGGKNTGDKGLLGCSSITYAQLLTYKQMIILVQRICFHLD